MLSKRHSIKNTRLITFLFRKGLFFRTKLFKFRYNTNSDNIFRYTVIIGKKNIKRAVDRNLLRRRIKVALRELEITRLEINLILNFKQGYLPTYAEIVDDMRHITSFINKK